MKPLLRRLSQILSQEVVQYSKLLNILSVGRRTLVGKSAEQINDTLKQQETLILELRALEEARVAVMDKLVAHFHTSTQKLTLVELASQVGDPFSSEYKQLSHKLNELLGRLEQVNQDNAYLIDRSLDSVNGSLRLFAASDLFGPGYSDNPSLKAQIGQRLYETV